MITFTKSFVACLASVVAANVSAAAVGGESVAERTATARRLCERYVEAFGSDETDLVYARRLDTPRGLAGFESAEAVANEQVGGVYKPYGYGAGFEDVAYHNGTLLFALCDAYEATRDPYFAQLARRIFRGMKRIGTLSPVAGFVPRGPHPNGKSYYRDSSLDQHTLYAAGLWRYARSPIADDDQRAFIRRELDAIARRMERNDWVMLVEDDSRKAHAGGGDWHRSDHLMPFLLAAVKDVTGDAHWQAEYDEISNERDGWRWRRLAEPLPDKLPRYTFFNNQMAFRLNVLARIEADPARKKIARDHLARKAADMFSCNFFTHWRRLDWIEEEIDDQYANLLLAPLGYTVDSTATIFDLWEKYDPAMGTVKLPDGRRRSCQGLTMTVPMMAWQIGLLSGDAELARTVGARIPEIHRRMDPDRLRSGWSWNYATVLVLLDVARLAGESDNTKQGEPR